MKKKIVCVEGISKIYSLSSNNYHLFSSIILEKEIEKKIALDNIRLDVYEGERIGLVGSNGSGKSTLLQIISKILKQTKGKVEIRKNIKISSIIELGTGFDSDLTVLENLRLFLLSSNILMKDLEELSKEILSFSELGDYQNYKLKNLSSGMKARLFFSSAILFESDLYIFDEVLSTGDMYFVEKCMEKIKSLRVLKKTLIIASHSTNLIRDICEKVLWLDEGKIVKFGKTDDVLNKYIEFTYKKKNKRLMLNKKKSKEMNFKLYDDSKKERYVFKQGEQITLEIKIDTLLKHNCHCTLSIWNNYGTQLTGWNFSEKGCYIKKNNYVKKIIVKFKNYLGRGKYYFRFGIVKKTFHQGKNDIILVDDQVAYFHSRRRHRNELDYCFETDAKIKVIKK